MFHRAWSILVVLIAACAAPTPPVEDIPIKRGTLVLSSFPKRVFIAPMFAWDAPMAQVAFHLAITNRGPSPTELSEVVLSWLDEAGGEYQHTLSGHYLQRSLRSGPWPVLGNRLEIARAYRWQHQIRNERHQSPIEPDETVLLPLRHWIGEQASAPRRARVAVQTSEGRATLELRLEVNPAQVPFRLPFADPWTVREGHQIYEPHALSQLPSQLFAYDLAPVGDEGETSSGPLESLTSYACYGRPVLAAADGEVVRVHDGVADNHPVGTRPPIDLILQNPLVMAGNFVVLKHQSAVYSAYLHLQPKIPVSIGQHVPVGHPLGRCGNSGNSREPHLHWHAQDGPDLLKAQGIPAGFVEFSVTFGRIVRQFDATSSSPLPTRVRIVPM